MRTGTGKNGNLYYHSEDVQAEISALKNEIRRLERELSESKNNRGGNISNLTPRQPKYSEDVQKEIARLVATGKPEYSKSKLAKKYGVTRATILNYCRKYNVEVERAVKPSNKTIPVKQAEFSSEVDFTERTQGVLEGLQGLSGSVKVGKPSSIFGVVQNGSKGQINEFESAKDKLKISPNPFE